MDAMNKAIKAVLREALDAVDVHPCDVHDDAVRAKGLYGPMADLYAAAIAPPVAAGSVGWCKEVNMDGLREENAELRQRVEKAEARLNELETAIAIDDSILRSSVPERWKDCTDPVGCAQSYIAELEKIAQDHGINPLYPNE